MANRINFTVGIEGLEVDNLQIDAVTFASFLNDYVILGSGKDQLSYKDVVIRLADKKTKGDDHDVVEMIASGTSLFAALLHRNASAEQRTKFTYLKANANDKWSATLVAQLLFMAFFYYVTQNQPLSNISAGSKFITNVLNIKISPEDGGKMLFETGIEKVPADWIKHIGVVGLQPEAKNRFALGVAGYRLLQAFLTIQPKPEAPLAFKTLWQDITKIVQLGPSWGFHPRFRTPQFISTFKSMNKTLEYALKTWGQEEQIAMAVDHKVLYRDPVADLRYSDISAYKYDILVVYANEQILS
jgi:hypothetical protein